MSFLSNGELTAIQDTELLLLTTAFTVSRPVRVSDGSGGWITSGSTVATVYGRMRPASYSEVVRAQQYQAEISHVLITLPGANVKRGDTLNGTYDVKAVRNPSVQGQHMLSDCLEHT